jgi:hypothetical protein
MADKQSPAAATPRAAMSAADLRHHEERFLKALQLLIEAKKAKTIDDLIRYADQDHQAIAGDYLRALKTENLPVDLCYDAVKVHVRIVAHKRNNSLLAGCQDLAVGLIMPLPPHVTDAFLSLPHVTVILPDGHHLPHSLQSRGGTAVAGSRAGRSHVEKLDVVVVEAVADGAGGYVIDAAAADVIDARILKPEARYIVHQRPHRNPEDVPFQTGGHRVEVL